MDRPGLDRRACGVLLPVFSLPSPHGIGCFSKEAYEFVGFLADGGQSYWQVLPLGPTSYGDSPYQSFSTFAGNPYFIDLETLLADGLLSRADIGEDANTDATGPVDYEGLYRTRRDILRRAFINSGLSKKSDHAPDAALRTEFESFAEEERGWLADFALFMALKKKYNGAPWSSWDDGVRLRKPQAMEAARHELTEEITFCCFEQLLFKKQWMALKEYANSKGISIIGDIPIYVAYDSADTWSAPELFQLDENREPAAVAGCPPDAFSRTGQLWGNPLYRWEAHRDTGYAWWMRRVRHCFCMTDVLRIDHFRGFESYYSVPAGHPTAEHGHWEKGPGAELFDHMRRELGDRPVIAEDLGFLTPEVGELLEHTGYPGMKVLQFAFGTGSESTYLPHNYERRSVVYTGTHDNDTTRSWYEHLSDWDGEFARDYLDIREPDAGAEPFIRAALRSVCDTAIIPMQDYLELDGSARINEPSTLGSNWTWRMDNNAISPELAGRLHRLAEIYGRI